jgi:hypothetical protein
VLAAGVAGIVVLRGDEATTMTTRCPSSSTAAAALWSAATLKAQSHAAGAATMQRQ